MRKKIHTSKRAQVSSQVFTYMMAAIIIAAMVFVGFNGIAKILKTFQGAPLEKFESDLRKQISSTSTSYMSVELFEFTLPSKYDEICFIDSLNVGSIESSVAENSVIKNKIQSKVEENIFLIQDGDVLEAYYIEDVDVLDDYVCVENQGRLGIWFQGTGKHACLKLTQNEACE